MSAGREPRDDEPVSEQIDKEAEQRKLEAAGWERMERQGKVVWRNPESGHLYPQGAAIARVRRQASEGAPEESEGEE